MESTNVFELPCSLAELPLKHWTSLSKHHQPSMTQVDTVGLPMRLYSFQPPFTRSRNAEFQLLHQESGVTIHHPLPPASTIMGLRTRTARAHLARRTMASLRTAQRHKTLDLKQISLTTTARIGPYCLQACPAKSP